MNKENKAGVAPQYAKKKDYKETLEKIAETEKCPFCPDNFKYHKKPILKKLNGWIVTENSWPYENTQYHFIFIPEKHKVNLSDLSPKDLETVLELAKWVAKENNIAGGGLTMRFGDHRFTGATVRHLHLHLIVPELDPKKDSANPVYFPIG